MLLFLALACPSDGADTAALPDATIGFLSPEAGATVLAGDIDFSVIVENFLLSDPAKHGDEDATPTGYIGVRVNGTEVLQSGETQFSLSLATLGAVTIEAELFHGDDGDSLDTPAVATLALTVE